jgi:hypothetical protein
VTLSSIRKRILLALFVVTPAGFLFKFYSGPGAWWFNDYGAGLLYEVFWILVAFYLFPKEELITKIPIGVFVTTCMLEVLQLWHPPFLEAIRFHFFGKALIGTSFSWWDFPHYAAGCLTGWGLIKSISKRSV